MAQKFRKKPVAIEAVQLLKTDMQILKVEQFLAGKEDIGHDHPIGADKFSEWCGHLKKQGGRFLKTLESNGETQFASFGDWIIKGVAGEFYPCKPDIFQKTYEIVD